MIIAVESLLQRSLILPQNLVQEHRYWYCIGWALVYVSLSPLNAEQSLTYQRCPYEIDSGLLFIFLNIRTSSAATNLIIRQCCHAYAALVCTTTTTFKYSRF